MLFILFAIKPAFILSSHVILLSFHFAFFHFDSLEPAEKWSALDWYRGSDVILKMHQAPAYKLDFYRKVMPNITDAYDHLWLIDEDMDLTYFNWDLYRTILLKYLPVASTPILLPAVNGGKTGSMLLQN